MEKPKAGRNDPCPCGSGKKYKKCCELKLGPKKIQATIQPVGESPAQSQKLSSLFSRSVQPPAPRPVEPPKPNPEETQQIPL